MARTSAEKKDANAVDYLKNAYLRVRLSHPSAGGVERKVEEANAEEFALICLRFAQDDSVRISVNDRALHRMARRVDQLWEMPHHREVSKDGQGKARKGKRTTVEDNAARSRPRRKHTPVGSPSPSSVDTGDRDAAVAKLARLRARKKKRASR